MDQPANAIEETFWRYVRGDLDEVDFEAWVYATVSDLETALIPWDFVAVINCDYQDGFPGARRERIELIRDIIARRFPHKCDCHSIADKPERNFGRDPCPDDDHLEVIAHRTDWIHLTRCRECGTHWLMGYDTVDDWVLARRLSTDAAEVIATHGHWPAIFEDNPNLWPRDRDQMMRDHDEKIRQNPNDAQACFNRGCDHLFGGDKDKAFRDFDRAIGLRQDIAWPYARRGDCYRDRGEVEAALRDYDRAIELDNNFYASRAARFARAGIYRQRNDFQSAIADYDRVIELAPGYADAFRERGMAYAGLKKFERAVADFDRAIELARKSGLDQVVVEALAQREPAYTLI